MKRLLALGAEPLSAQDADRVTREVRDDFRFWTLGIPFAEHRMRETLTRHGGFGLAQALLETYRDGLGRGQSQVWVEHSPENLLDLPWLLERLPEAKVVHILRDGRGVLASFRGLDWGPHSARRAADYWLAAAMTGAALSATRPGQVMTVRYEDILAAEAPEIRRLAAFIGVPTAEDAPAEGPGAAGAGASFRLPDFTRQQHNLVGGAVVAARAEAWRTVLSPRDQEIFEHFAGVGLHHFGYMPACPNPAFHYGAKDAARDYLRDGWKLIRAKVRQAAMQRRFVRKRQGAEARSGAEG